MWLNSDSESLVVENSSSSISPWIMDTLKTVMATSTAVVLTAVITKIQGDIVNVGVPQNTRLGMQGNVVGNNNAPNWGNSGFSNAGFMDKY